jgi:hypothetical protein
MKKFNLLMILLFTCWLFIEPAFAELSEVRKAYILEQAQKRKLKYFFYKKPNLKVATSDVRWAIDTSPEKVLQYSIPWVDMSRVRLTWLTWYNEVRSDLNLNPYSYHPKLDITALEWSELSKRQWFITHRRNPSDSYYDYWKINSWFEEHWIKAKNVNRVTHTENIGYGYYSCSKSDCTDELIKSIKNTFLFFMSEKGKSYDAHYKSIIKKEFKYMWLGIAIDPSAKRYYLTVHYITDFE